MTATETPEKIDNFNKFPQVDYYKGTMSKI